MHNTASSEDAGHQSRTERLLWTVRGQASMWEAKGRLLSVHDSAEEACAAGSANTRGGDYVVQRELVEASTGWMPRFREVAFARTAHRATRRPLQPAARQAPLPSGPYGRDRCGHVGRCHCRGYAR